MTFLTEYSSEDTISSMTECHLCFQDAKYAERGVQLVNTFFLDDKKGA